VALVDPERLAEKAKTDQAKFRNPDWTARGERRATVGLETLQTLWFNTGTLCNITCRNCYIESSPSNDRLVYLTADEVRAFLDEIAQDDLGTVGIGFTRGAPANKPRISPRPRPAPAPGVQGYLAGHAPPPPPPPPPMTSAKSQPESAVPAAY